MSDDLQASRSHLKKRRIPGACDICKRKKIRCKLENLAESSTSMPRSNERSVVILGDSGEMPDNRCSNCVQYGFECTHKEVTKTLGSAKGYVESLEARLEKMDRILAKLLPPDVDLNREVDRMDSGSPDSEHESLSRNDDEHPSLAIHLNKLTLNPQENRYFGKSSGFQLIQTALDLKSEYSGGSMTKKPLLPYKRDELWNYPSWAVRPSPEVEEETPVYAYPDNDLIPSLIEGYFQEINTLLPLLHRPTFEASVSAGLHYKDPMFGAVLSLVCAHGARFSEDPRVLSDGTDSPRSAGWKWYEQVVVFRRTLIKRTTLYELQMFALHVLFSLSNETPQGVWAEVGLAVRLAQEVGAHRRRRRKEAGPNMEDELWKRAFWVIMSLDRHISSTSGRPCGLQDEDLDLELPIECDDEYWGNGFQQPSNKPSSIAYFNSFLGLMDILAYAMRLIYSIKRPKRVFGQAVPRSEQQVIAEMDSTMNNWMDSVPSHLRWNPNCQNKLFLKQSAALHATYYHLQIFIHRPFIPSPRNPVPVSFPSLAICTNAARSCCHVLESFNRLSSLPIAQLQNTVFTAAVILLLNIWSGKRSGYAPNPVREMEDVQCCLGILKASERRWSLAGRYWDILTELASAGDVAIPSRVSPPLSAKKRNREADVELTTESLPASPGYQLRSFASTRRVSSSQSPRALPSSSPPVEPAVEPFAEPALFSLPMYSNELGRLPVYGQFNFSDSLGTHMPVETPNFDQLLSYLTAPPQNMVLPNHSYAVTPIPTGPNINRTSNNVQSLASSSADLATLFNTPLDVDAWSQNMPTMDNETMNMWSMAPTNLEFDDWNMYISSVEQMTQAQAQTRTRAQFGNT